VTEAEYLETKLRGTGRPTNLIKNSPKDCVFVVQSQDLATHFKKRVVELGRYDVMVLPYWSVCRNLLGLKDISDIVFDHYLDVSQDRWDEMYELREIMRLSYKENGMSKLEELKKDLLLIENSFEPSVSWSKYEILVNKYAPGLGVGLKGFQRAKEEIELLIKAEESAMTPFQRAKDEYDKYGANGFANDYIAALEKCQPWIIRNRKHGEIWEAWIEGINHKMPLLFITKENASEYLDKNFVDNEYYDIVQWEG
jgi:hypothetical protein